MAEETNPVVPEGGPSEPTETPTHDVFSEFFDVPTASPGGPASTEAPTEETPPTEVEPPAGTPPVEGDEASTLRAEIMRMASVMASHGITYSETPPVVPTETPVETPPVVETPTPQVTQPQWGEAISITDEVFQDAVENKDAFEKILTNVRDNAVERTIQSIPLIVTNMVKQQLYLNNLANEFYKANEDLADKRPFVGVVANELSSKNPGWDPQKVLEETGLEVRKRLNLKPTQTVNAPSGQQSPGLPSATTRKGVRPAAALTGLEKELQDMM